MSWSNPWTRDFLAAPLNQIQDELHRVLGGLRTRAYVGPRPEGSKDEDVAWTPAIDLVENPDSVGIMIDLPGVEPDGVELSVSGNVLTIRGDKRSPIAGVDRPHISERVSGHFVRDIPLPSDVDAEGVDAQLHLGVLTVTLPKIPAARARTIPIRKA
jgi:HSP20 family protein